MGTPDAAPPLAGLLNIPILSRLRRNHGLEHATLHMLARQNPRRPLGGVSDPGGFWLVGDLTTDEVMRAVQEALQRLQAGEETLAVHPNCGTNFAAAGLLAALASLLAMSGSGRRLRDKLERLPLAVTLATLALVLARPLGLLFQARVTTSGRPQGLEVASVVRADVGPLRLHRVLTRG